MLTYKNKIVQPLQQAYIMWVVQFQLIMFRGTVLFIRHVLYHIEQPPIIMWVEESRYLSYKSRFTSENCYSKPEPCFISYPSHFYTDIQIFTYIKHIVFYLEWGCLLSFGTSQHTGTVQPCSKMDLFVSSSTYDVQCSVRN